MTDKMNTRLGDLKARQHAGEHMRCPRCGADTMKAPIHTNALSRHMDIYICDACGMQEAILDYTHAPLPIEAWAALLQKQ